MALDQGLKARYLAHLEATGQTAEQDLTARDYNAKRTSLADVGKAVASVIPDVVSTGLSKIADINQGARNEYAQSQARIARARAEGREPGVNDIYPVPDDIGNERNIQAVGGPSVVADYIGDKARQGEQYFGGLRDRIRANIDPVTQGRVEGSSIFKQDEHGRVQLNKNATFGGNAVNLIEQSGPVAAAGLAAVATKGRSAVTSLTAGGVAGANAMYGQVAQAEEKRLTSMPSEEFQQLPAYKERLQSGMAPDEAREDLIHTAKTHAGNIAAPFGALGAAAEVAPFLKPIASSLTSRIGSRAGKVAAASLAARAAGGGINLAQNEAVTAAVDNVTGEKRVNTNAEQANAFVQGALLGLPEIGALRSTRPDGTGGAGAAPGTGAAASGAAGGPPGAPGLRRAIGTPPIEGEFRDITNQQRLGAPQTEPSVVDSTAREVNRLTHQTQALPAPGQEGRTLEGAIPLGGASGQLSEAFGFKRNRPVTNDPADLASPGIREKQDFARDSRNIEVTHHDPEFTEVPPVDTEASVSTSGIEFSEQPPSKIGEEIDLHGAPSTEGLDVSELSADKAGSIPAVKKSNLSVSEGEPHGITSISRLAVPGVESNVPGATFYSVGKTGAKGYREMHEGAGIKGGKLISKILAPEAKVLTLDLHDPKVQANIAEASGGYHEGPNGKRGAKFDMQDPNDMQLAIEQATKIWKKQGYDAVVLKNHPDAEMYNVPDKQVAVLNPTALLDHPAKPDTPVSRAAAAVSPKLTDKEIAARVLKTTPKQNVGRADIQLAATKTDALKAAASTGLEKPIAALKATKEAAKPAAVADKPKGPSLEAIQAAPTKALKVKKAKELLATPPLDRGDRPNQTPADAVNSLKLIELGKELKRHGFRNEDFDLTSEDGVDEARSLLTTAYEQSRGEKVKPAEAAEPNIENQPIKKPFDPTTASAAEIDAHFGLDPVVDEEVAAIRDQNTISLDDLRAEEENQPEHGSHPMSDDMLYSKGSSKNPTTAAVFLKNSVVKDPVYHGTDRTFDQYGPSDSAEFMGMGVWDRLGSHFGDLDTAHAVMANRVHVNAESPEAAAFAAKYGMTEGANIRKVYLKLENPFYADGSRPNKIDPKGPLSFLTTPFDDVNEESTPQSEGDVIGLIAQNFSDFNPEKSAAKLVAAFKAEGYDGIIYRNDLEGQGGLSYIAFDPNQQTRTGWNDSHLFNKGTGLPHPETTDMLSEQGRQRGYQALADEIKRQTGVSFEIKGVEHPGGEKDAIGGIMPNSKLIEVALRIGNGDRLNTVIDHETFHAAQNYTFNKLEMQQMDNAFKPGTAIHDRLKKAYREYDPDGYAASVEGELNNPREAQAYAYEMWRQGKFKPASIIERLFNKIANFFPALKRLLDKIGLTDASKIQKYFSDLAGGKLSDRVNVPPEAGGPIGGPSIRDVPEVINPYIQHSKRSEQMQFSRGAVTAKASERFGKIFEDAIGLNGLKDIYRSNEVLSYFGKPGDLMRHAMGNMPLINQITKPLFDNFGLNTVLHIANANAHIPEIAAHVEHLVNFDYTKNQWRTKFDAAAQRMMDLTDGDRAKLSSILFDETISGKHADKTTINALGQPISETYGAIRKTLDDFLGQLQTAGTDRISRQFRGRVEQRNFDAQLKTAQSDVRANHQSGAALKSAMARVENLIKNNPNIKDKAAALATAQAKVKAEFDSGARLQADLDKAKQSLTDRFKTDVASKKEAIDAVNGEFEALRKKPYFPLSRFGQYTVEFKNKDGTYGFSMAETVAERDRLMNDLKATGATDLKTGALSKEAFATGGQILPASLLKHLDDFDDKTRAELTQLAFKLSNPSSFLKHRVARKGTPGFSTDFIRAFANYGNVGASYLARTSHMDILQKDIDAVRNAQTSSVDKTTLGEIANDLGAKLENTVLPGEEYSALKQVGFAISLAAVPAAFIANLTAIPMMLLPDLAARHGTLKASAAMLQAVKDLRLNSEGHFEVANADPQLKQAMKQAEEGGLISQSMITDIGNLARTGPESWRYKRINGVELGRMFGVAAALFSKAEEINRNVAFAATHRLEMGKHGDPEVAYRNTEAGVRRTMFEYARWNRPDILRGKGGVVFQFKNFALHYSKLLLGNFNSKSSREDKLASVYMLGMLALMAGARGLPGAEDMMDAADWVMSTENTKFDIRTESQKMLKDLTSDGLADIIFNGITRGTPFDMQGSLSAGRQIPFVGVASAVSQGKTGSEISDAIAKNLGPTVSWATQLLAAMASDDPDTWRKWEKVMPRFARGPSRALRYLDRDVETTSKGAELKQGFTIPEEALSALGFNLTDLSEKKEQIRRYVDQDNFYNKRRSGLIGELDFAVQQKDPAEMQKKLEEIASFNLTVAKTGQGSYVIMPSDLQRALSSRAKSRALLVPKKQVGQFIQDEGKPPLSAQYE